MSHLNGFKFWRHFNWDTVYSGNTLTDTTDRITMPAKALGKLSVDGRH